MTDANIEASPRGSVRVLGRKEFLAGERGKILLEYDIGEQAIQPGGHLWFLWDIRQWLDSPQCTDPTSLGYVRALTPPGKAVQVTCPGETRPPHFFCMRTLDLLPEIPEFFYMVEVTVLRQPLEEGQSVVLEIGASAGYTLPRNSIDEFQVWVIPDAQGSWTFAPIDQKYHSFIGAAGAAPLRPLSAVASISIHGRPASSLEIVIPSFHHPDIPLPVRIRAHDEFYNTCEAYRADLCLTPVVPGNVQRSVSYQSSELVPKREIALPQTGDHSPEVMRVMVKDRTNELQAVSNPSWRQDSREDRIYWGILHGMFFSQRPLDYYFEYARNEAHLDFVAGMHFSYQAALANVWVETKEVMERHHAPEEFITFLGVECDPGPSGHKTVLFKHLDVPPLLAECRPAVRSPTYMRKELAPDTIRCDSLQALWAVLHGLGDKQVIVTAHHTADWRYHDPTLQRLAEIYSKWGTCEYLNNPLDKRRPTDPPREYVQDALELGHRLGIIAGGDTHDSRPGNQAPEPYGLEFPDGLTAVCADSLTREAIWTALWNRRTYGTTGARILLEFEVNDEPMGGEVVSDGSREVQVRAVGTAPISKLELIRDNEVVQCWQTDEEQVTLSYSDEDLLPEGEHYYYLRLTQVDGQMAWSSPVWVLTGITES